MNTFKNLSIKWKLILIITSTSIIAVVSGLALYLAFDMTRVKNEIKKNAILNANLVGQYATAPLLFGYKEEADEIMTKLNSIPSILDACLYSVDSEEIFATYHKIKNSSFQFPVLHNEKVEFKDEYLHVFYDIKYKEQYCGTIYFRISTSSIHDKFINSLLVMVALVLLLLIIVYFISSRLQKLISSPLLTLAELTAMVSKSQDFTVQLKPQGNDEIGILYQQFNNMLSQILKKQKERDLADEELRKLTRAVEQSPISIIITDVNGCIEYANPKTFETMKVTMDELIGKNPFLVKPDDSGENESKALWDTISSGKTWHGESKNINKNGELYWESTTISPITDFYGKITNYLAIKEDITERKAKDEEINKLSLAIEQNPVVVVITDLNGNIEYVNPAFQAVTGYSRDEVIGKNPRILKSGLLDQAFYSYLWNTILKGNIWHGELVNKKKNGEFFWEIMSITPIHDSLGKITNYLAVKQDITQRKQAEQEIRELNSSLEHKIEERTAQLKVTNEELIQEIEERRTIEEALLRKSNELETFFSVSLDLLCIADISGNFIKVNRAWENILGYSKTELEHRKLFEFIHSDDLQATLDAMNRLSEKNPILNLIDRYKTKDGSYRYIEWHSVFEGNLIYAAARDITERKRTEDFEFELLQLSSKMTGIATNEIADTIEMSLERIGQFLVADRAYVFEFDWSKNTMTNTYEWCNERTSHEIKNIRDFSLDTIPEWTTAIKNQEVIYIPSVRVLPPNWKAERDLFNQRGIKSLLVIPMYSENDLIGFVGLDTVSENKVYNKSEVNILKVWSRMLSSLISKGKTERLLEQTRQNYETFFNTLDDFLWVLDKEGNIIHFNNTALTRLEFSLDELVNKSIITVNPPDRQEEARNLLGKLLSGSDEIFSIPVMSKSGKIIPVETKAIHGFWNGQPIIFKVSKDISQIKLSEQKFSTAFQSNSAMMAISYFDEGQYVDINNAFLEVLSYSRDEIIGKTNKELKLFVDPKQRKEILDSLNQDIPVRKVEILMRTKDGIVKTGLLSADSIFIDAKRCLLTVTIDITERKKAEEALKIAQLEADKANIAKSEFLSRMSHELRTPMNSILGFAQLLNMGELNAGQKKGVNHILHSGKHLLDLINEVLDISRIEAGRLSLSMEPVKIFNVIQEVIDIAGPLAAQRQILIEVNELPDNLLHVKSDKQRLKQVILNLINNAIKYNRDGGKITISTELIPKPETGVVMVRISISDTGIGISKDNIKNLFKPFERIGAENTQIEGSGLGLAVVKKLIDALDGKIGVESELNKGTTFWIELPKTDSPLEGLDKTIILSEVNTTLVNKRGTIVYIEDNTPNIELVDQILKSHSSNIRLLTCKYGREALNYAHEYSPDLILLDLNLPDMHGSEVLKILQSNEKTKSIPVIIISADAMPQQLDKLINAGAKKYLTKPLDVIEFLKVVSDYLKQ
jgi:PAS domain S-box-containing protein